MATVLLVIHLMIAAGLVGVVLLQRSEGGGLGMGGGGAGGGGAGGFLTGRGTANLLTRATAGLAACFFLTSLLLTIVAQQGTKSGSAFDKLGTPEAAAPAAGGDAKPGEAPPTGGGGILDQLQNETPRVPQSR